MPPLFQTLGCGYKMLGKWLWTRQDTGSVRPQDNSWPQEHLVINIYFAWIVKKKGKASGSVSHDVQESTVSSLAKDIPHLCTACVPYESLIPPLWRCWKQKHKQRLCFKTHSQTSHLQFCSSSRPALETRGRSCPVPACSPQGYYVPMAKGHGAAG